MHWTKYSTLAASHAQSVISINEQTSYIDSYLLALVILFLLPSCKKADLLSNDERSALFLAPTTIEIYNILSEWQNRNLMPTEYKVIEENEILAGQFKLKIVSFRVDGIKEYGALLIPQTASLVPVRIFVGGFGLNSTTNSMKVVLDASGANKSHILAIPALRGQSLQIEINGTVYSSPLSEGEHCDAFDGATDDVLAFLNLIHQTERNADVNRTSARGGSRGGTVALLAGIRDNRIKRTVGVVCPTNMLELTAQNEHDPTYQCQFLSSFKNGQSTLAETRNKMIASSPYYFAQHLPLTQLHLGLKDWNVPVKLGYDLNQKITALGMSSSFQLYTYDRTHTDIATNNGELSNRIERFLSQL